MNQDRRQHPRLIPDSALLVSVDRLKRAFLCDLSEGGIAFAGLASVSGPSVISVSFELPDGGGAIEAIAEIVWTCDSLHRTGARFLQLAEASRQQLRDWISARIVTLERGEQDPQSWSSLSGITGAAKNWILQEISEGKSSDGVADATSNAAANAWETGGTAGARWRSGKWRVAGIVFGMAAVCAAFVTVGYYLPALFPAPKASSHIFTSDSVRFTSSGSITPVRQTSGNAPGRYDGFVLQVGAMAHKENAEALAEKLRAKSFPAFVFDQGGDGLYRVDVGPYPDADYARGVKEELAGAGFKTALQRQLKK